MVEVQAPTFEQHHDGFGVNQCQPRISWKFVCNEIHGVTNWRQIAYDLQLDDIVYHVQSAESVLVPWPGKALASRQRVNVRVRAYHSRSAHDNRALTQWSPWSSVEAGLLSRADWSASGITTASSLTAEDGSLRPVRFRRVFEAKKSISKARIYLTSAGVYEATLNGKRIGDHHMAPGWTSYKHRQHYQLFDVSKLIKPGELNVLGIEVGAGWYASALGWLGGRRCRYGDKLAAFVQLEIYGQDTVQYIFTDTSWKYELSSITSSEIYNGETQDMRIEDQMINWNRHTAFDDSTWKSVITVPLPSASLCCPQAPPVRVIEKLRVQKVLITKSGKTILDFGQNMVGRLSIRTLQVPAGDKVTLKFAEVLKNGELGVRPLRTASCTDVIISSGSELRDWSPKFTFHGFRYVQVDGICGTKPHDYFMANFDAQVLHTDMQRTGEFECSHPMINKLHRNALWSMKGNFLSLPTDCPQRDERLGWTGDIAIFASSANYLYNVTGMLGNWLEDLACEQSEPGRHGVPPLVVPSAIEKDSPEAVDHWWPRVPQAIWGDSCILVPWELYQASGDISILRRQFNSMREWLTKGVCRGADDLWHEDIWQLGDWLDPNASPNDPGDGRTDGTLVADFFLVHVSRLFAQIASLLQLPEASTFYTNFTRLQGTFRDKYVTKQGLVVGDTQTALTLAIHFDLLEVQHVHRIANRLASLVRKSQFKIATGFAGTPYICHALMRAGHPQLAYRMVLNKALPSWMYQVEMGATTIWERWDSMLPDGSINPGEMTSFNHYALGSIIDWMYKYIGGLSTIDAGWKRFKFAPVPGGTVTSGKIVFQSPYGEIKSCWSLLDGNDFRATLVVPPNCEALVILPFSHDEGRGDEGKWVGSGVHEFRTKFVAAEWPPKAFLPPFWDQTQPEYV